MLKQVLITAAISAAIPAAIAFGTIASQSPADLPAGESLDFEALVAKGIAEPLPMESAPMRDGWAMPVRHLPGPEGAPLLVLIHGSGWNGQQFDRLGRALEGQATILAPDLRGHGANPQRRGDIDHLGQYDEDLADLIAHYAAEGQRVILAGHSSGGGLAVRFAGGPLGGRVDHAVLMAPFLKYNAPTTRENSGGWAHVLTRRMIGLSMLNGVGFRGLNHLTVIQFAMPQAVLDGPLGHTATTAYSYRLNTSYAPRGDYLGDVAALPAFSLIVGAEDEAFYAEKYEGLMAPVNPKGDYTIVPGANHMGVVDAPETLTKLQEVLGG